jgi:hypothetical protein
LSPNLYNRSPFLAQSYSPRRRRIEEPPANRG